MIYEGLTEINPTVRRVRCQMVKEIYIYEETNICRLLIIQ